METKKKVIEDLKGLVDIVNDGKAGYLSASEVTNSTELRDLFLRLTSQRVGYANELENHITLHGGSTETEEGGILGVLHRTWIDIKEVLSRKEDEDEAILGAIETGEQAAIEKYDRVLEDYATHADHIVLLQKQRTGILEALKEIETYHIRLER